MSSRQMSRRQPAAAPASRPAINDCWNKIGVWGDGSCPELQRYIHCRNCPVYTAAATELLDGPLPAGYLTEWTRHFAEKQQVVESGRHSVVITRIAEEWFALPTALLVEVAGMRAIHALPHRRGSIVLGLVNVRGELLVCASLGGILSLESVSPAKDSPAGEEQRHSVPRLLVVIRNGVRIAFPVDEVHGTHRYHPRELKDVPATVAKAAATYIKAVLPYDGRTVGLLDDELLFHSVNHNLA